MPGANQHIAFVCNLKALAQFGLLIVVANDHGGAWLHNVTGLPWAKGGRSAASMAQQRERKREAANKRKGCHRERESPSNRRSLPTCAGQPFRSAHLLHEQL